MSNERTVRMAKVVGIAVIWLYGGYIGCSGTGSNDLLLETVALWIGVAGITTICTWAILNAGTGTSSRRTGGRR